MSVLLVLLLAAGALAVFLIGVYNGLVQKKVASESAWANIEVQLKRRHDLIPNLVETVKGYASHEKDTLDAVIKARNSAVSASSSGSPATQAAAEGALSGALRGIFALSEAYPDLKANQNFLQLQGELATTETLISGSRQEYNQAVQAFNTGIQQVPGNLVAGYAGFTAKEFFELSEQERVAAQTPPKVSFS
jgi:LemA protein